MYPFHHNYSNLFVYGAVLDTLSGEINIPSRWYGFFQVIDTSVRLRAGLTMMGKHSGRQMFVDFGKQYANNLFN